MTGNEIRETFLKYFERNNHRIVRSSPLLPTNDPTLLFANAGMNQFKDVFTGLEKRDYTRATSSQKCLRAGGKHNDLDEVGKTARHHTFFEMLGNFSFGDYFKRDAIGYAWDLLLNVFNLPLERLWFTVYTDDDEAEALWIEAGVPRERVVRFGAKDNFWQMGDTGPCGPCSEIHYYTGDDPQDPSKNHVSLVNAPEGITLEIWNLVFMQFERDKDGNLNPLPKPSVDTGAGLERLAAVMQGVKSNYDTDLIRPIIDFISKLSGIAYVPASQEGFAMRVIADHARAAAFSIADSIIPGNEGRNYVLRKIMRRAIYHGNHTLHFQEPFFNKVTDYVVGFMNHVYPELETSREIIERIVRLEEDRFSSTLNIGLQKLDALFAANKSNSLPDYKDLAKLYDTFGTPRDLIRVGLEERGFQISEDEFEKEFETALRDIQQTSAREQVASRSKANPIYSLIAERVGQNEFTGYQGTHLDDSHVLALIKEEGEVDQLNEGDQGEVILDRTPFYAESGGQVGDTGIIVGDKVHVLVNDTVSPFSGLIVHRVKVDQGSLRKGDVVRADVDVESRDSTRRNHTATHLLHAALREVLGGHVKQAGSLVAPHRLRFDYTHFQPLTLNEIAEIEWLVNNQILLNQNVQTDVVPIEEAMKSGAMALFGEKYADRVRVLTVPGFSKELCGGTHVRATGDIGLFKIIRDEAIASGTRRLEAVTGADAFKRFQETEVLVDSLASGLRTSRQEISTVVERLQEELKRTRREVEDLKLKIAAGGNVSQQSGDDVKDVNGIRVLAREVGGLDASAMRHLSDTLLARIKSGVVILGRGGEGKASIIVRVSSDLQKQIQAGQLIKELAPIIGGRGGGKPDMAEGGGPQPDKLPEALEASYGIVKNLITVS
jgi:alanyl-tRNA synthetase